MVDVETLPAAAPIRRPNVADRLARHANTIPDSIAVACPWRRALRAYTSRRCESGAAYATTTFAALDADATRIARGLKEWGVPQGTRLALLVRPDIEFVTLVFALLRAGMVIVLVDPGMGKRNLVRCLSDAEPEGFVAIGLAQAARLMYRRKFPRARWNVTVGRRRFWGGKTLDQLRLVGSDAGWAQPTDTKRELRMVGRAHPTQADDPAAIIFTSGSTGPPKGVLYTHRMFETQVDEIQSTYGIEPGGVDLACFPLFGLFNAAMGVTTVLPEMDFSQPATADPKKLLRAAKDWQVTQAFASPAVWRVIGEHCAQSGDRMESLRQVFSCGAPVPADVMRKTLDCVGMEAKMHTPYGATECLPVSTIEATEVLGKTAAQTDQGAGVCVGRKFDSIEWRIVGISDDPIASLDDAEELPRGEIGELIVRGPQVSPEYVTRTEINLLAKIGAAHNWHRVGDVGYLDEQDRFWYCGRKSQRARTKNGPLFTEKIEAVFNSLPGVRRSALVGVGPEDNQSPVIVVEPLERGVANSSARSKRRQEELVDGWYNVEPRLNNLWYAEHGYVPLKNILFHPNLPVDVRHNAKINRELLAKWAAKRITHASDTFPAH